MAVLYIDEKLLQYLEHVLAGVLLILNNDGLDKISHKKPQSTGTYDTSKPWKT